MHDPALLIAFIVTALVVLVTPGPGVLYVVTRSATQGYWAGLASVLGLAAGALVHVVAAGVGLSAILLTSATAFGLVKALGAGYLVYLGLRTLFARQSVANIGSTNPLPLRRLFLDGVVVSTLNPKIAVFFLAFLPQFVDPSAGPVAPQLFMLGILCVGLAVITDGGYALLAGSLRHWLRGFIQRSSLPRYFSGGIYIGLGIHAAFAQRQG